MKTISLSIFENKNLSSLPSCVEGGALPALVSGLGPIHRANLAAALRQKTDRPLFVVAPDGTTLQDSALGSETVEGMNKQYSIMKYVQSYTVITVPANRTGTVNLRWGPSKNTNLVMKAPADYELTVLAESRNWLMCSDPATGRICYVARKFTNAQ